MTTFRNEFVVTGRTVSIKELEDDQVVVTLIVKTAQDMIFPSFICDKSVLPEACRKDVVSSGREHTYLEASGYAEGHYSTAKGRRNLIPKMIATSVKVAPTLLNKEFGVKGRFWEQKLCFLYVSGLIEEIEDDGDYMRYTITTAVPDTGELVPLKIHWKKIDRHPDYKPGDKICAACKVTTPRKRIGSEERHFINFNVFDMDYLD